MKVHMNRKLHDKPVKKRKFDEFNELVDVIGHEKINSFFCSCNKCIHWEKYEECKICNAENICSNEEMDVNHKENNFETDENEKNTFEEKQKLLKENELTHYYCAHCVYTTNSKLNMKRHMKIKHTHS